MSAPQDTHNTSRRFRKASQTWVIALLAALLVCLFVVSLTFGRYPVPLLQVIRILLSSLFPFLRIAKTWTASMYAAVVNIRLPRVATACLVGCCLSTSGAAYQGVFQNPMASPDLLGATSGAAFGAALAILMGLGSQMITVLAFAFSLFTVFAVYFVGQRAPGKRVVSLILAGIMISSLFSAGTSYIKLVADPTNQLPAITYWLMGSLSGVKSENVLMCAIPMAIGLVPLIVLRWRINLLSLGDDEARTLGVNANGLRLVVVACSTLITAASVSVSGMIGWVGLVVPHICRMLVGNDYRRLMPASMLFGALFLLAVDNISRNLLAVEIPIGILTAFVGAPFFLYLIMRKETSL